MAKFEYVDEATVVATVGRSTKPLLLQFSADWCGPCRQMAPMIDEIASVYQSRLDVLKINVDDSKTIAAQYNVRGVPHFVLVKGGADAVGCSARLREAALTHSSKTISDHG